MLRVVALTDPPDAAGLVVAVGDPGAAAAEFWLQNATFTLVERSCSDPRTVQVPDVGAALSEIAERVATWPQTAAVCDDVLRSVDPAGSTFAGVITESLAYSTLQSGREFARWLARRGLKVVSRLADPVIARRDGDTLHVAFNRPQRHNAFSTDARAALLDALEVARLDPSVTELVLTGNGQSFCSGGDLAEFGTFDDPASAHLARTRYSPALVLDEIAGRLGTACRAVVHGQVLGSGLEMASFCGRVTCHPDATLRLPELELGLIPGAGGTVSVTRRIGRWRTAYLVLSGAAVSATTALAWGLVDDLSQ
ncbi:enoyl-CoA hydratase [Mycobacterium sp. CBMA 234]|uniref:enoyl-CoA hydratase/isomerase family protein n=1 Tax=Mycolicibacterium sp. CBMA 234 TaxID=1918495 RepID=UPI0035CCE75B|nr:enoyl-CoA hydratase [Mycolicibacterium sp. CBMA 234]